MDNRIHPLVAYLLLIVEFAACQGVDTVFVPTQYATIGSALSHGTIVKVRASLSENLSISGGTYSIVAADTSVVITGGGIITNSTINFVNIKLVGTKGADGTGSTGWDTCPQAYKGSDGITALTVTNSTISFSACRVIGGAGGNSGVSYVNTLQQAGQLCNCTGCGIGGVGVDGTNSIIHIVASTVSPGVKGGACGSGGMLSNFVLCFYLVNHTSLNARQGTVVDTSNAVLSGGTTVDSTSKIVGAGTWTAGIGKSIRGMVHVGPEGVTFHGIPTKNLPAEVLVYAVDGRLRYAAKVNSEFISFPKMHSGAYLVSYELDGCRIMQKFILAR